MAFCGKSTRLRHLAALLAGLVFPYAFAPVAAASLVYLALGLLFWTWLDASPWQAALRGFLFGLGQFSLGVYWIHVCLHDYARATELAAFLISAACVIFLAGFPALAGLLAGFYRHKSVAVKLLLVFPAIWVLCEWLRAWLEFPGFPWLQIGYSQIDGIPGALAPILGVYGIGHFVAFSVGAALYWFRPEPKQLLRLAFRLGLLFGTVLLLDRIQWTSPAGDPLRVALLQGNIEQQIKWKPEAKEKTIRWYFETTLSHLGVDLIVWPETSIPVSYHRIADPLQELGQRAVGKGSDLLVGIPLYDPATRKVYNSLVLLGATEGRYLKRHLVPFGEYFPFQPLSVQIAQYMDFQMLGFLPGPRSQAPLNAAGIRLAPSICYEDVFGQEMLDHMPQALLLVNSTNDAWFGQSIALEQNLQMARMRSRETGRFLIRAANTGLSAIIAPDGKVAKLAPPFTAAVLSGQVQPMSGRTPYMAYGDYLILGLLGVTLLFIASPLRFANSVSNEYPSENTE